MPTDLRLPYPHPGQIAIREQAKRTNILCAGRRWFKSSFFNALAIEAALQGQTILWGAPTADQTSIGWDEAQYAARGIATFKIAEHTANFPNGGKIIYRSLDDPNNARGFTIHGAILDEAPKLKSEAYHDVVRPMLITTRGWTWMGGTPDGRNWFWQEHAGAKYKPETHAAWSIPTLGADIVDGVLVRKPHPLENPHIPFSELQAMFDSMPERSFRQEILAEFLEDGGAVFRGVDAVIRKHDRCTSDCSQPCREKYPCEPYQGTFVAGLDWGRENDYTDMTVLDAATGREVDHMRINRVDWEYQRSMVKAIYHKWGVRVLLAEYNSIGSPNIEALRNDGLYVQDITLSSATKKPIIEALVLAVETKKVSLGDIPENDELKAYQQTRTASGNIVYSAPKGLHDDRVISLALAYQGIMDVPVPVKIRVY